MIVVKGINSNIKLFFSLGLLFLFTTLALNYVKVYERSVFLAEQKENRIVGEKAIMNYFRTMPVEKFLKYEVLKILRQVNDEDFEVLSETDVNLEGADVLWSDYAEFKDKNDNYIARTSPCLTKPTTDVDLKKFCVERSYKDWFQYQFWFSQNISRQGKRRKTWTFKQRLIPENAVTMRICSEQVITVHKSSEYGNVDKIQHVCSELYALDR